MAIEIRVPTLGESVTEATVGQWFKKAGDTVTVDEPLCELETDKVTVEVPAPSSGTLASIAVNEGDTVEVGAVIGSLVEGAGAPAGEAPAPAVPAAGNGADVGTAQAQSQQPAAATGGMPPSPAARKILDEKGMDAGAVAGSGRRGQVLKEDAMAATAGSAARSAPATGSSLAVQAPQPVPVQQMRAPVAEVDANREERVRMTRLRQTIARRLKDAQNTAAMLTTFNDVDMSAVMTMRSEYKDLFEKRHGVKLGFMSFFVKACIQALKDVPAVNAEIEGAIADFGRRARDGNLGIEEMQGGTFTISNGGVYGSMLSTPILNAPQSGILGMHRIEQRPVVLKDGSIAARPMMYLALSYDHRIVDGKEAVTFLVRVKECLEDPQRFILEL
jgi:2-oxoglutarate dehydrogenase E2 component (dihydrolipoamide succinyltransferase)